MLAEYSSQLTAPVKTDWYAIRMAQERLVLQGKINGIPEGDQKRGIQFRSTLVLQRPDSLLGMFASQYAHVIDRVAGMEVTRETTGPLIAREPQTLTYSFGVGGDFNLLQIVVVVPALILMSRGIMGDMTADVRMRTLSKIGKLGTKLDQPVEKEPPNVGFLELRHMNDIFDGYLNRNS